MDLIFLTCFVNSEPICAVPMRSSNSKHWRCQVLAKICKMQEMEVDQDIFQDDWNAIDVQSSSANDEDDSFDGSDKTDDIIAKLQNEEVSWSII